MKIAIVSNSDAFFPLAHALLNQRMKVDVFYSPNEESYTNQKVAAFVKQVNLPLTEEKSAGSNLYNWLLQGNYTVCFILGYKYLVNLESLKTCQTTLFNIHFGPLPAYRGAVPVFWQLKIGESKLGLCIHHLSQKFDDGPVVWLKEIGNLPHYNYQSVNQLFNQLCVEGAFYILQLLINKLPLPEIERSAIKPAYQKRPGLHEVMINWQQMPAIEVCNLVRAGNPWNKGAITFFKGQETKLLDAQIVNREGQTISLIEAGTILDNKESLQVSCIDGIISVNMLFYNDFFMPAYQCRDWGFKIGEKFG